MVREIGVQAHPFAVAAAIGAGDFVPDLIAAGVVDPEVAFAAKLGRRMAHIDSYLLRLLAAQLPQLRS